MAAVTRSEHDAIAAAEWTFRRGEECCAVERACGEADSFILALTTNGDTRTYAFSTFERLLAFQSNLEDFLLRTGWSLDSFAPERRRGRDRRRMPRVDNDRRRWWTDPAPD